jgi:pantoate--beta-alanine ligase
MRIIQSITELQQVVRKYRYPVIVPTMGNLHDGHLSLVHKAKPLGDVTVATIFVNRLQFGPNDDFDQYPRTFEADCEKLEQVGCDIIFAPNETEMYPETQGMIVVPPSSLTDVLEGHYRPGFFTGVATVVTKLLNATLARVAIFGQKDYQQLLVIRAVVKQLNFAVEIVGVPTCRAFDGLALSSRNTYLNTNERSRSIELHQAIIQVVNELRFGHFNYKQLEQKAEQQLREQGWLVDYIAIRKCQDLTRPDESNKAESLLVLGAAKIGGTRLIDNVAVLE